MALNWLEDLVAELYRLRGYLVIENEPLSQGPDQAHQGDQGTVKDLPAETVGSALNREICEVVGGLRISGKGFHQQLLKPESGELSQEDISRGVHERLPGNPGTMNPAFRTSGPRYQGNADVESPPPFRPAG
ncbi:MAG: hypothetical protein A2750_01480 [Candidatus Yanofskybacteria bacterium RIFCSPHIGHO2_01_FULL_45_42]|uniref:Uncharacterized protein n=1 Tax=Candidatus Yanofskybacteria bacterium RIFCSPHIGHO2_01_FULL_45_42 TaxID=1802671 RepID=A0A1F8F4N1_9BACT|nr:MAG: hypothetical protein A2750_01480 [Candidatus Yanofskybacteria bacterium RIFCSPHIGHO2_01_FULL_45_42]OGY64364.1 MAG: hypothetical protein A3J53_03175 [Candidatus Harrisonbacteria bacterium RIFCSPHIGHO2_02_FULL_40_20]